MTKLVVNKSLRTSIVQGRNGRDRLMALATPFGTIVPLIFYYQCHLRTTYRDIDDFVLR